MVSINQKYLEERKNLEAEAEKRRQELAKSVREAHNKIVAEVVDTKTKIRKGISVTEASRQAALGEERTKQRKELRKQDLPITKPSKAILETVKKEIENIESSSASSFAGYEANKEDLAKWETEQTESIAQQEKENLEEIDTNLNRSIAELDSWKQTAEKEEQEFEAANIKLDDGTYVDKIKYNSLGNAEQTYLKENGLDAFNNRTGEQIFEQQQSDGIIPSNATYTGFNKETREVSYDVPTNIDPKIQFEEDLKSGTIPKGSVYVGPTKDGKGYEYNSPLSGIEQFNNDIATGFIPANSIFVEELEGGGYSYKEPDLSPKEQFESDLKHSVIPSNAVFVKEEKDGGYSWSTPQSPLEQFNAAKERGDIPSDSVFKEATKDGGFSYSSPSTETVTVKKAYGHYGITEDETMLASKWNKMSDMEQWAYVNGRAPTLKEWQEYKLSQVGIAEKLAAFRKKYKRDPKESEWDYYIMKGGIKQEWYEFPGFAEVAAGIETLIPGTQHAEAVMRVKATAENEWNKEYPKLKAYGIVSTPLENLGITPIRTIYPQITAADIEPIEYLEAAGNILLLAAPVWVPKAVRGIKTVATRARVGTYPFSEPAWSVQEMKAGINIIKRTKPPEVTIPKSRTISPKDVGMNESQFNRFIQERGRGSTLTPSEFITRERIQFEKLFEVSPTKEVPIVESAIKKPYTNLEIERPWIARETKITPELQEYISTEKTKNLSVEEVLAKTQENLRRLREFNVPKPKPKTIIKETKITTPTAEEIAIKQEAARQVRLKANFPNIKQKWIQQMEAVVAKQKAPILTETVKKPIGIKEALSIETKSLPRTELKPITRFENVTKFITSAEGQLMPVGLNRIYIPDIPLPVGITLIRPTNEIVITNHAGIEVVVNKEQLIGTESFTSQQIKDIAEVTGLTATRIQTMAQMGLLQSIVPKNMIATRPATKEFVMPSEAVKEAQEIQTKIAEQINIETAQKLGLKTATQVAAAQKTRLQVSQLAGIEMATLQKVGLSTQTQVEQATKTQTKTKTKTQTEVKEQTKTAAKTATKTSEKTNDKIRRKFRLKLPTIQGKGITLEGEEVDLPVGTYVWKQGMVWRALAPPWEKLLALREKPTGYVRLASGKGSATTTFGTIGGVTPNDADIDMGIMDISIRTDELGNSSISFSNKGLKTDVSGEGNPTRGIKVSEVPEGEPTYTEESLLAKDTNSYNWRPIGTYDINNRKKKLLEEESFSEQPSLEERDIQIRNSFRQKILNMYPPELRKVRLKMMIKDNNKSTLAHIGGL